MADYPLKHQALPFNSKLMTMIPMAFLDSLLKSFTAFPFPRYKKYRLVPCQPSGNTAARVNKPVRLCSHSSPLQLSLLVVNQLQVL